MNTIYKTLKYALLSVSVITLFSSCEHKELCFNHPEHALKSDVLIEAQYEQEWEYPYKGFTDWISDAGWPEFYGMLYDDLRPGIPSGLRVQVYDENGQNNIFNIDTFGGVVPMIPGEHSILFYNNDTEYILFNEMSSYVRANATTRTRTRASYIGNQYMDTQDENTVNPPDMLYGHYIDSYTAQRTLEPDLLSITMHPLVFTYLIRYEFEHGLEYVALARGALAGMAESVYLNSGQTSEKSATILFDCTVQNFGTQALVRSFGVPDFPNEHYSTRGDRQYGLNLEVRLRNGKIISFDFDVTDQVQKQPQGGIIFVRGIKITDDEGKENGSGFDVEVEDWGDYEDIQLPLTPLN